jgi:MSHA biogenesis protein MshK
VARRALCIAALLALGATARAAPPLVDPTRPPALGDPALAGAEAAATGGERFVLSSVLVAGERRVAVVNDRVVSIGDVVDGARVTAIKPYAVTLALDAERLTVTLPGVALDAGAGREKE